jgi:acetolactate synthase-1/2/3 large subunit
MGMVRQWQELLHGGRYSESYMESLPDFVKLAEAFGAVGLRCHEPDKVDETIKQMIDTKKPVVVDMLVDKTEYCFPMIPSGAAHYDMLLGPDDRAARPVSEEGMVLV